MQKLVYKDDILTARHRRLVFREYLQSSRDFRAYAVLRLLDALFCAKFGCAPIVEAICHCHYCTVGGEYEPGQRICEVWYAGTHYMDVVDESVSCFIEQVGPDCSVDDDIDDIDRKLHLWSGFIIDRQWREICNLLPNSDVDGSGYDSDLDY